MRKILLTLAAVLCCNMMAWAQRISEQEAMERALQYMNGGESSATAHRMAAPVRSGRLKLKGTPVEASSIYVFNREGGGYVIASADSRALPVLGYCDSGSIEWNRMPENMRAWLKQYDEAMATLGTRTDFVDGNLVDHNGKARRLSPHRAERKVVEPLIKTHWNQQAPYYDQTPLYEGDDPAQKGKRSVAGCMATAMAQILNFYQWPKTLEEGLPAYDYETTYNGVKKMVHVDALPPVTFDWDNMLNDYQVKDPVTDETKEVGTEAERAAVAALIRYCGQSLNMEYSPALSNAIIESYEKAYRMLGYPHVLQVKRNNIESIDSWEDIVYQELAAGRPLGYTGMNGSGGHAFVCDGYDGNGLFHFNWGWGGQYDGYFSLSVLNPTESKDVNLGSSSIGYCINQAAVINTDPMMEEQPSPKLSDPNYFQGDDLAVFRGDSVKIHCLNYKGVNVVADMALGTKGADRLLTPRYWVDSNDSIIYSDPKNNDENNIYYVKIDSMDFQAGESLELYPMMRLREPDAEWQVIPPLARHVVAGRTEEGAFYISSLTCDDWMTVKKVEFTKGNGRLLEPSDLTVTFKNNWEVDYTKILYISPRYYGKVRPEDITEATPSFEGAAFGCCAFLKAGEEGQVTFPFLPQSKGCVMFEIYEQLNQLIGSVPMILSNDTIINYEFYLENRSRVEREGDQSFYHVELCDRAGVQIPNFVPHDSLLLRVNIYQNGTHILKLAYTDEVKQYLKALPERGGHGDYKFVRRVPLDLSKGGTYKLQSYMGVWSNIDNSMHDANCIHQSEFHIDEPTGVKSIHDLTIHDLQFEAGACYDLQGRRVQGVPTRKGIYIRNGRKVVKN